MDFFLSETFQYFRKKLQLTDVRTLFTFPETNPGKGTGYQVIMIEDEKIEDSMSSLETTENAEALRGKDTVEQKNRQSNFRFQNVVMKLDHEPPPPGSIGSSEFRNRSAHLLLLISTCAAAGSLLVAFQLPNLLPVKVSSNHSGGMFPLLLYFNSIIFFASMALITILMHKLPILPWLLISVSSKIGAYMCAVIANSPPDVVPVLFIGSSIFAAAFLHCVAPQRKSFNLLR
ncbi:uncharacterized protein LOC110620344 [Manihot esculenta]|uniref:Uncharacterized protein n=2 Tax=Manihot esculenta TaxID=3983 RepID=A0ACB7HAW1_MANES|nr:uncharacterized protein LOC110620344 [Manihot esculenta]KAG8648968.1 hypothetical protein MANES_08G055100v8 [Manihot esculenta]